MVQGSKPLMSCPDLLKGHLQSPTAVSHQSAQTGSPPYPRATLTSPSPLCELRPHKVGLKSFLRPVVIKAASL